MTEQLQAAHQPVQTQPVTGRTLQRTCACGKHAEGGECAACRQQRVGTLQRAAVNADPTGATAPPIVHDVLRSPGQPLDDATRGFMDPQFGHDFSHVRVHAADRAAASTRAVHARASTVAHPAAFDAGRYRPGAALQRMVRTGVEAPEADATAPASRRREPDGSRMPLPPPAAGAIQTKLAIHEPGDRDEQDADRVAEHVMRTPEPRLPHERLQTNRVQPGHTGQVATPPSVHEVLRSPGQPLDPPTRAAMEQRFGHDFSGVRVHTGAAAEQSAQDVKAHAYTVGHDVVFGAGRFAPATQGGRRLLAHELTHVVQQSGPQPAVQRPGSDPANWSERVTDAAAPRMPAGLDIGPRNRATTAFLRRMEVTTGSAPAVRLTIGSDVNLLLVMQAWTLSQTGPLDDKGLATLRQTALLVDETIDDNERTFLAALLDAGNAKRWHAGGEAAILLGRTIEFDLASITSANRARVRDFARAMPPSSASGQGALDKDILAMAGPFAVAAQDALTIADEAKIPHETIFFAMLNGASDSTPGDRAFAGAVYAIARREHISLAADLMAQRFKVDQVPKDSLPEKGRGMYQPSTSTGDRKGDTVYLPSDIRFGSIDGQATVIHELAHVAADANTTVPHREPVVDAELAAFRVEAAFLLDVIAKRSGADRKRVVAEIAKDIELHTLLCAVLVATEVLENNSALAALKELHAEVRVSGNPATALGLSASDMNALLRGLADDERHYETQKQLEKRARNTLPRGYRNIRPALVEGFRGESALDVAPGTGQTGATLQRQPQSGGDTMPATDEIEFIIGGDISVAFARRAKKLAAKRMTRAAEVELHDLALQDDTVSDAERMVIAALADAANAKAVAEARVEEAAVIRLTFPRDQATRDRVHQIAGLGRPAVAGAVTAAEAEVLGAALGLDAKKFSAAGAKVERAAEVQILKLAGGAKVRAKAVLSFSRAHGIGANMLLRAMINGASDSTPGDMVAAGAVYAIAEAAGHDLASAVRSGQIKVDEKAKLESDVQGFEPRAIYSAAASDLRRAHGPRLTKGDTMYLPSSFDISNLADRATVIHELQHASDDRAAAATGPIVPASTLDLELAAYTAGARYELEQLSRMPKGEPRTKATAEVAAQWNDKRVLAAVLASRTEPASTPGKWIEVSGSPLQAVVGEVVAAVEDKAAIAITADPAEDLGAEMKKALGDLVGDLRGEITRGGAVDPGDRTSLDSLSGESMLDIIDRMRPVPRK